MKLNSLRPMLETDSVAQTIEYYTNILGFKVNAILRGEADEPFWCNLEKDGTALMFNARGAEPHFPHPMLTGSLYFNSDDINALWQELKDKTAVEYPIQDFFYEMREFAIRDPNGYLLQFGQPISEVK